MVEFTVHDERSASGEAAAALAKLKQRFGFIPNLYGVLAESPQALTAYQAVSEQFRNSALSKTAQHVVWLVVSRNNGCEYCVAVHSAMATMAKVDGAVIDAIRENKPIDDPQLEAVRTFTNAVVEHRGWVPEDEMRAFLDIAHTPLDDAFAQHAWTRQE